MYLRVQNGVVSRLPPFESRASLPSYEQNSLSLPEYGGQLRQLSMIQKFKGCWASTGTGMSQLGPQDGRRDGHAGLFWTEAAMP